MALGTGILFLVLGSILAFAVGDAFEAVDLVLVGYICMGAGVLAIILSLIVNAQRSNNTHREVVERPGAADQQGPVAGTNEDR